MRKANLFIKRCMDLVGSIIGLIILSPLFIIIAVSIKISSEGPILFRQDRVGKNGRVITIIKFRTMIVNAENLGDGLCVKEGTDPRITMVGRFLAQTSLNEFTQIFTTLDG